MGEKKRILAADDAKLLLTMVKDILEGGGYEVITASDGLEALNKARSENPDLIILDIEMPKMPGYHVCRMLKFDEQFKHIPIVMLTARDEEKDRLTGLKTGADVYITKPVDPDKLLETVSKLLEDKS